MHCISNKGQMFWLLLPISNFFGANDIYLIQGMQLKDPHCGEFPTSISKVSCHISTSICLYYFRISSRRTLKILKNKKIKSWSFNRCAFHRRIFLSYFQFNPRYTRNVDMKRVVFFKGFFRGMLNIIRNVGPLIFFSPKSIHVFALRLTYLNINFGGLLFQEIWNIAVR